MKFSFRFKRNTSPVLNVLARVGRRADDADDDAKEDEARQESREVSARAAARGSDRGYIIPAEVLSLPRKPTQWTASRATHDPVTVGASLRDADRGAR